MKEKMKSNVFHTPQPADKDLVNSTVKERIIVIRPLLQVNQVRSKSEISSC